MDAAVRVQALRCLTTFLSWLPASVGARSLSGHPPPTGDETFSKTEYYSIARQPRPRQFRTTWRVIKELSIYVSARCNKTHLSGPMKKHTTWQVFSLPQYGATNYLPACYGIRQKSNHPPGSLTYIRNIRHLDENIVDIRVVSDIVMLVLVAGVGRRPLAQVLRNSLSWHPPPTGHGTNTANPKQHLISWIQPTTGHGTWIFTTRCYVDKALSRRAFG